MYSIGLMSGTSMDGIDAALLETDGEAVIKELAHSTLSYTAEVKILLKAAEYAFRTCRGDLEKAKIYFPEALNDYLSQELKLSSPEQTKQDLINYLQKKLQTSDLTLKNIIALSTYLHGEKERPLNMY